MTDRERIIQLADVLRDALQDDIEQGVKWLSEAKAAELERDWPQLHQWLDHFFEFVRALEEEA